MPPPARFHALSSPAAHPPLFSPSFHLFVLRPLNFSPAAAPVRGPYTPSSAPAAVVFVSVSVIVLPRPPSPISPLSPSPALLACLSVSPCSLFILGIKLYPSCAPPSSLKPLRIHILMPSSSSLAPLAHT
ncbi:hypothetical protein DFH09DRAFT_1322337 [Mycena vulgaris]|nr:hypothetical protein DFH09DRAFT_1322337 [Mycena vulgaris]